MEKDVVVQWIESSSSQFSPGCNASPLQAIIHSIFSAQSPFWIMHVCTSGLGCSKPAKLTKH